MHYSLLHSPFGEIVILWQEDSSRPGTDYLIHRILLSRPDRPASQLLDRRFPNALLRRGDKIDVLGQQILAFLRGEEIPFDLSALALSSCSHFQREVLRAESRIPRGWVSTYSLIARYIGRPKGARAVGNALAQNPFPILIPCHRALRSDGALGGFQGGMDMKRALLEMEGIAVSTAGKVSASQRHYFLDHPPPLA